MTDIQACLRERGPLLFDGAMGTCFAALPGRAHQRCELACLTAPEEIAAVGDSDNDLAMLRAVGCPVAMGNATDEVKAAAALVTDTNGRDGVAKAILRLV